MGILGGYIERLYRRDYREGVSRGCVGYLGVGKKPAAFLLAKVGSRESDIFGYRTAG